MSCPTIYKSLRLAAVSEHEVVLSVSELLGAARHEHVVVSEEVLKTSELKKHRHQTAEVRLL